MKYIIIIIILTIIIIIITTTATITIIIIMPTYITYSINISYMIGRMLIGRPLLL